MMTFSDSESERHEHFWRTLVESAPDVLLRFDPDGRHTYVNPAMERETGLPAEALVGKTHREIAQAYRLPTHFAEEWEAALARARRGPTTLQQSVHTARGTVVFDFRLAPEPGEPGVASIIAIGRNVTDWRASEQMLKESEERYRLMVEGSEQVFFYEHDAEHRFTYLSPSVQEALGYRPDELLGQRYDALLVGNPSDLELHRQTVATLENGERANAYTARVRHRDGRTLVMEIIAGALHRNGRVAGVQGFARDISERIQAQEALREAALTDPLTGLPNRLLFMERLKHAMARSLRHEQYAVLFLDLDRFKLVNDSLGHQVGDQLLVAVAERLAGCLRPEDTVARMGGDEFAVLLEGLTDPGTALHVAERIQSELRRRIDLDGYPVFSAASIGIVYGGPDDTDAGHLMRSADMAMYRAKATGAGRSEIFDRAMHAEALARLQLETDLRHAIEREEFRVFYQPVVDLATGHIAALEALVRWQHPERGMVPPLDFIGVAEETGLIVPLGEWVIAEVCRNLPELHRRFPRPAPLAVNVNLSVKQFAQPNLVERLQEILRETGAEASALKLEITESVLLRNADDARAALERLRALGVQVHIDDFGTGYSSLSYLHTLPLDALKIDRSFIEKMSEDPKHEQLVRTILGLAHGLGIHVVAEGVTTLEQLEVLRDMGCAHGQGYLFSAPIDPASLEELLIANPH